MVYLIPEEVYNKIIKQPSNVKTNTNLKGGLFIMEEIKNETTMENTETKEGKENKKKVKSFKMDAAQVDRVNELLAKVNGSTDAEKLIESLDLASKRTEIPELPTNLNKAYEGDREKIATALHMIHTTFETLMINTSEVIDNREAEIKVAHHFEINKLLAKQTELEERIEALQKIASEAQDECEAAQRNEAATKKEAEAIRSDAELKDGVIKGLTSQLEEAKEEVSQVKADSKATTEKFEGQLAKKDAEIAELVTDSRKYKAKIETLESKNEELLTKSIESQQENQVLTGKLSILEVNYQNEQAKNEDLKARIAQLQTELTQERANVSQIQLQFMQLMSSKEKDTLTKDENKNSTKTAKKFKLEDERGKIVWTGSKSDLIKRANQFQKDIKVSGTTDISVIEEIFNPLTLKY